MRPGCLQTTILEGVILYMHVCVHLRRPQGKPPLVSVGLCAHAFYSLKKIAHSAHATYCMHFSPNLCDSLIFLSIFVSKFDHFGVYFGGGYPLRGGLWHLKRSLGTSGESMCDFWSILGSF